MKINQLIVTVISKIQYCKLRNLIKNRKVVCRASEHSCIMQSEQFIVNTRTHTHTDMCRYTVSSRVQIMQTLLISVLHYLVGHLKCFYFSSSSRSLCIFVKMYNIYTHFQYQYVYYVFNIQYSSKLIRFNHRVHPHRLV